MTEPDKHPLVTRWNGHEEKLQAVINIIREDPKWYGTDEYKELLRTWGFSDADIMRDLSGANLGGANLRGANLRLTSLVEANFQKANLWGADLRGANLVQANLRWANLFVAKLQRASLQESNLQEANLWGGNLQEADFSGADLRGADLSGANLSGGRNLTIEQLSHVKTLYQAKLDTGLMEEVKAKYPHLFEKPKDEKEKGFKKMM